MSTYYYGTWRGNTKYHDSIDRRAYPTTTTFFWLAMVAAQSQSDGCLDAPVICRGVTEQDLLSPWMRSLMRMAGSCLVSPARLLAPSRTRDKTRAHMRALFTDQLACLLL